MRTKLIRIGNSKGVRLPRSIIEQVNLGDVLDITVRGKEIVIRPVKYTRNDWEKAAIDCHDAGDDNFRDWDSVNNDCWQ